MKIALLATMAGAFAFGQQASDQANLKLGGSNRDREFTVWMKSVAAANGALQKMDSKTGKDAVEHAEKLGSIYESMIGFWRQRGAQDAVKLSMEGKTAAIELAEAAHGGNADQAAAANKKLAATCKACHDAHRTRLEDGTFLIRTVVPKLGGPRPAVPHSK